MTPKDPAGRPARYHGWMAFRAEAPMAGIDPHPAYAPHLDARTAPADATEWARLIGISPDRARVVDAIADDAAEIHAAVEEGDLQDAEPEDVCLAVCVDATGTMTVFTDATRLTVLATHAPKAIWEAFGMSEPATSAHIRRAQARAMRIAGPFAPALPDTIADDQKS